MPRKEVMAVRLIVRTLAASGICFTSTLANAADEVLPNDPAHVWSGFYVGLGFGGGAVVHDAELFNVPSPLIRLNGLGGEGVFGELTAGYDYATGNGLVFGVGANARLSTVATTLELGGLDADITNDYGFDVFARAGYLVTPQTLAYALAGYSYQHFDINATGAGSVFDWGANGFVVGAGIETAISQRIHLKGEYRYSQYGEQDFGSGGLIEVLPSMHTVSLGVTYRLGDPAQSQSLAGAAPVDFSGFYVGLAGGGVGLSHGLSIPPFPVSFNGLGAEGLTGRVQAGYDHELSNGIVAGVQFEYGIGSVASDLDFLGTNIASIEQDNSWAIIGRLGYKVGPRTMVFGLGGYTQEHYDLNFIGAGTVFDFDTSGFVAGGGVETALTDKVFLGAEYRYTQTLESFDLGGGVNLDLKPSAHAGLMTLKLKF
ncbi:MAG: outer membrane beta-barrel protein [Pseudomonadota bacterium]